MNLRVVNGKPVYSGQPVVIGDISNGQNEFYVQVCRKHYFNPPNLSLEK